MLNTDILDSISPNPSHIRASLFVFSVSHYLNGALKELPESEGIDLIATLPSGEKINTISVRAVDPEMIVIKGQSGDIAINVNAACFAFQVRPALPEEEKPDFHFYWHESALDYYRIARDE